MKRWTDLLPGPFTRNPAVHIVMAPNKAVSKVISTRDKYELGVLELGEKQWGLQVIHPQLATYTAHADIFVANRIPMARPEYVGELLTIPQHLLVEDEYIPLVFIRDAMWRPYLNLRKYAAQITKRKGVDVS